MEDIELGLHLRDAFCVFVEDDQWMVALIGDPRGMKSLSSHVKDRNSGTYLFENDESLATFLSGTEENLELFRQFARLCRKYPSTLILTAEEQLRWLALDYEVSPAGTGFWVKALDQVILKGQQSFRHLLAAGTMRKIGRWDWNGVVSRPLYGYRFEVMLQAAGDIMAARLAQPTKHIGCFASAYQDLVEITTPADVYRVWRRASRELPLDVVVAQV